MLFKIVIFGLIMFILKVLVTLASYRVKLKSLGNVYCFIYCILYNICVMYCIYIVPYLLYVYVFILYFLIFFCSCLLELGLKWGPLGHKQYNFIVVYKLYIHFKILKKNCCVSFHYVFTVVQSTQI